ncbi:MAG: Thioredoxin-dependent 5'-adenylylsulfate reductase [Rhodocyclaceae bacterium]|nr:Thioredoxin-dependent 5'-adenylylsulfate reductase [Rhodocyclaceae bacterium]
MPSLTESTPVPMDKVAALKADLAQIARDHAPVVLANSLGVEDMLLTDVIARDGLEIGQFLLDTGRLPAETYALLDRLEDRYGIRPELYFPRHELIESYVSEHGINGFYRSVDLRKRCCAVRKVEPLARALSGKRAWITGLRRQQAASRTGLAAREDDHEHGLIKFNPLADWTEAEVWAYIRAHDVPYNALHDHFYPSIGCAPCTRAITPGEDVRAGRWWWEEPGGKECGLHPDRGAAVPIVPKLG